MVKHQRWINSEQFHTIPTGYIIKVNLFFNGGSLINFELTPTNTRANDTFEWPKIFTMTVTMFNQAGNYDNYHTTKDLEVKRKEHNDEIRNSMTL